MCAFQRVNERSRMSGLECMVVWEKLVFILGKPFLGTILDCFNKLRKLGEQMSERTKD